MESNLSPRCSAAIDEKAWLSLLADSAARIRFNLQRVPSRFRAAVGWDTGEKRLQEHLVYFLAENRCMAILNGKRLSLQAGTICWITPGTEFRFFYSGEETALPLVYRFRFSAERDGVAFQPVEPWRLMTGAWAHLDPVKQLTREVESPSRYGKWQVRNLISQLSIAFFETPSLQRSSGPLLNEAQRESLSAFISDRPEARLGPADLARHLGFSPDYFARLFRRSYQMSPRDWLLQQRLNYGAALLRESNLRVSEIAERLGYKESYLFIRQFHQQYGMSPTRWRKSGEANFRG